VAGGLAASAVATTTATTTTVPATQGNIILAHGWGGHKHGWGWGGGYGHGYGYGGGCRWLKRKWHRTGRHYWKKRYFRCINRY
jgi:hypothetical protein